MCLNMLDLAARTRRFDVENLDSWEGRSRRHLGRKFEPPSPSACGGTVSPCPLPLTRIINCFVSQGLRVETWPICRFRSKILWNQWRECFDLQKRTGLDATMRHQVTTHCHCDDEATVNDER
jgi:hypothetical protein